MSVAENLLSKAYVLIQAGNFHHASRVLDSLLLVDPMNVEAWEAYMQISESCEKLDDLCGRILLLSELTPMDRESILDFYYFLRRKLRAFDEQVATQEMITFELVDQFTYTLRYQFATTQNDAAFDKNFEQRLAKFLRKVIIIQYGALLTLGLKLFSAGNNFCCWIILVLAISILISLWNVIFHVTENHSKPRTPQLIFSSARKDKILTQPKLAV